MPHYEQTRHAISARKHSLENLLDGFTSKKNKIHDENHEAQEKMVYRLRQIQVETRDMVSYCEQIESSLRREI